MEKKLKQISGILDVLRLKRQLIEKTAAELTLKLKKVDSDLLRLSRPAGAPGDSDDDLQLSFAVAAQKWDLWRKNKQDVLQAEKNMLMGQMQQAQSALRIIIVQIETMTANYQKARKQIIDDVQSAQSRERLELWQASQADT